MIQIKQDWYPNSTFAVTIFTFELGHKAFWKLSVTELKLSGAGDFRFLFPGFHILE